MLGTGNTAFNKYKYNFLHYSFGYEVFNEQAVIEVYEATTDWEIISEGQLILKHIALWSEVQVTDLNT